ncbi:bifunctional nitrate reductase/sulfite reductase flavoprotein subunit alpha [Streptomyces sp. XM4193]|nr:bifunctional nitrate reductase/sulfite reductase flavoprotein subunit alpha [Streptomyces sp. XM4193]MCK1795181.1 bifunctional nitrate reductase/sulfite reductase flavoprotein subunit alpha [Streptomyces sp. XM4193]
MLLQLTDAPADLAATAVATAAAGDCAPRVVTAVSGDPEHPANRGRLCTKGATTAEMLAAPGRLSAALVRPDRADAPGRPDREAAPVPTPTAEAVAHTARRLRAIVDEHGPDSVALYVSGQMSIEAQYLANKLAKGYLRTRWIESNSRLCMAGAGSGYKLSLGADGPPGSYDDLDRADLFLVIGSNMADCHPVLFLRMMDRVKRGGAKLIVVDPRRTATAEKADLFLRIRPGTDLSLLNGLLRLLVDNGHTDDAFIAEHTTGWPELAAMLADYPPERVASTTGIPEADLREAARLIGEASSGGEWTSCWTMGLNQSTHGTWNTNALINLHLATGAICRPGSGPFSLTGQPNAMGGREMGYMGPGLPGQRSALDAEDRARVEELWGIEPGAIRPDGHGRGTVDLFERMARGEIRACWIICTNPVASVANRDTVIRGLEAAELVVTQDVFAETETNTYADVVLPGAMWSEAEGVLVNSERSLTLAAAATEPPGDAWPDWRLIAAVARGMGYEQGFSHDSAEEVFEEITRASNPATGYDLRGVSHERLRAGPVQWPAAPDGPDRNPVRYRNDGVHSPLLVREDGTRPALAFPTPDGRAVFHARPHLPAAELPDDDHPFVLNTGRVPHQWHTLTKTGRVPRLNRLNPGPFVEIHPRDAHTLRVVDGDRVRIASRRGHAVLPAVVTDRVREGSCFAPFHWNDLYGEELSINAVTNDAVDPISFQPEFKVCAVALSRVGPAARTDIPEALGTGRTVGTTGALAAPRAGVHDDGPGGDGPRGGGPGGDGPGGDDPARGGPAGDGRGEGDSAADDHRRGSWSDQVPALQAVLGIADLSPPTLDERARRYLGGFLAALAAPPAAGHPADPTPFADAAASAALAGAVPVLPADAPLDPAALHWVNGLLAGHCSRTTPTAPPSTPPAAASATPAPDSPTEQNGRPLLVLWASQTGNAEEAAQRLHRELSETRRRPRLLDMSSLLPGELPRDADLLLVTSTYGDGEAPDNGTGFWEALTHHDAPRLDGVRYSVLALGDSSYTDFCGHGRRLDAALEGLGAHRLAPRADCEPDCRETVRQWTAQIRAALSDRPTPVVTTAVQRPEEERPTRLAPFTSRLVGNRLLGRPGGAKEVRQFTLTAEGLDHRVGDALGVLPLNCPSLVAEWLDATRTDPNAPVHPRDLGLDPQRSPLEPLPLSEALLRHFDITRVTPGLLRLLAERGGSPVLRKLLRPDNTGELTQWTWGRQAVDVLKEFPVDAELTDWLGVLGQLRPRRYSISSSPLTDPGLLSLTVSVVRYGTRDGLRTRKGVASTFLADAPPDSPVQVFVQPTAHFRPPTDPQTPMIMVGPGTGVAPFLGFLQERQALGHSAPNWLFFGEQHEATDFYHRDRLVKLLDDRVLTRLDTAFSRDQRNKVYVQDRLREHGAKVWSWLRDGAHFYVCGDASRMAGDVDRALHELVALHGGLDEQAARAHVKQLASDKRYVRDVY